MPGTVVAKRWRPAALAAIGAGLTLGIALAVVIFHGRSTAFDSWWFGLLSRHIGSIGRDILIGLSTPAIPLFLLALVVPGSGFARRWELAVLAVAGPVTATLLAEYAAKRSSGACSARRVRPSA